MSKEIVPQNQELRKTAMAMVIHGLVSRDGKDGQCLISTDDGLYLANATACTCSEQPCPHTLAADLYNRARYTVETILERRNISHITLSWIIEDDLEANVTDPDLADKMELCLAVCQQLHREMLADRRRDSHRFQSSYVVSLAGLTRADGVRMTRGF